MPLQINYPGYILYFNFQITFVFHQYALHIDSHHAKSNGYIKVDFSRQMETKTTQDIRQYEVLASNLYSRWDMYWRYYLTSLDHKPLIYQMKIVTGWSLRMTWSSKGAQSFLSVFLGNGFQSLDPFHRPKNLEMEHKFQTLSPDLLDQTPW